MTFYKVTKNDLTSAIMREDRNHGLEVQYKLGEFVHADPQLLEKGFGLFVFNNLESALDYCAKDVNRIFEAEVETVLDTCVSYYFQNVTKDLILNGKDWLVNLGSDVAIVSAVKLVKEIKL